MTRSDADKQTRSTRCSKFFPNGNQPKQPYRGHITYHRHWPTGLTPLAVENVLPNGLHVNVDDVVDGQLRGAAAKLVSFTTHGGAYWLTVQAVSQEEARRKPGNQQASKPASLEAWKRLRPSTDTGSAKRQARLS